MTFGFLFSLLTWFDSTHRASVCASTAVNTYVRIDHIDVTLRDCSYRALRQTCTTCCTIFCNSVSHFLIL